MKFCPKCGHKQSSALANFCESCGSSLNAQVKSNPIQLDDQRDKYRRNQPSSPLKKRVLNPYGNGRDDDDESDADYVPHIDKIELEGDEIDISKGGDGFGGVKKSVRLGDLIQ